MDAKVARPHAGMCHEENLGRRLAMLLSAASTNGFRPFSRLGMTEKELFQSQVLFRRRLRLFIGEWRDFQKMDQFAKSQPDSSFLAKLFSPCHQRP